VGRCIALAIVGTVVGRVRREFPGVNGKPARFNLTLAVQTEAGLQRSERWSDTPSPSEVPQRGQRVVLPLALIDEIKRTRGAGRRRFTGRTRSAIGFGLPGSRSKRILAKALATRFTELVSAVRVSHHHHGLSLPVTCAGPSTASSTRPPPQLSTINHQLSTLPANAFAFITQ
jgi:hypothetical protein